MLPEQNRDDATTAAARIDLENVSNVAVDQNASANPLSAALAPLVGARWSRMAISNITTDPANKLLLRLRDSQIPKPDRHRAAGMFKLAFSHRCPSSRNGMNGRSYRIAIALTGVAPGRRWPIQSQCYWRIWCLPPHALASLEATSLEQATATFDGRAVARVFWRVARLASSDASAEDRLFLDPRQSRLRLCTAL